ncbi:DNA cytosine methyltransferase [uncultured Nostoc sp.]|uniref:DNA cytosine methyltransferase n=1 Tax=uncultured Nostoc sp. TaxID=340711 RepID=UPI0035CBDBEB
MPKLRQLDLCSGVGAGFPFAAAKLGGFKLIGLAEIDDYCCDILTKRFPNIANYGDVQRLAHTGAFGLQQIDLITASPPCQPFSVQGQRLAATDERNCFPAVLRIINIYKPRFAIIENVAGLLSCPYSPGDRKLYIDYIGSRFKRSGYSLDGAIISSGNFAAPFDRRRLLLVASANSIKYKVQPSPWSEQIREFFETERDYQQRTGSKPGISRECLQSTYWLDRSTGKQIGIGVNSGNGTIRDRRAALGNALDWRVATVGLRRVLYLNSLI